MSEKKVIITEVSGEYEIQSNDLSDFELIGILESLVFELKNASRGKIQIKQDSRDFIEPVKEQQESVQNNVPAVSLPEPVEESKKEAAQATVVPDIRTRIGNAVKAIRELGGEVEQAEIYELSEEELQIELEELTAQYKRLKSSKGKK